jgi:hypothetical protein
MAMLCKSCRKVSGKGGKRKSKRKCKYGKVKGRNKCRKHPKRRK